MAEYIDKSKAINYLNDIRYTYAPMRDGFDFAQKKYDAFTEAIEAIDSLPTADVEPVRRWIPVTERLPKPNTRIIAYMAWKQIITLEYQNSRWYLADRLESIPDEAVTHWMPPPSPPEEDEA